VTAGSNAPGDRAKKGHWWGDRPNPSRRALAGDGARIFPPLSDPSARSLGGFAYNAEFVAIVSEAEPQIDEPLRWWDSGFGVQGSGFRFTPFPEVLNPEP